MARTFLIRAAVLAALWASLTGAEPASWIVGGPVIAAVAAWPFSAAPTVAWRFRPSALVRLVPFFLWRSFLGSCDVAWRALHARPRIEPAFLLYRLRLPPEGPARVVFANALNLLPGTMTADWETDALRVHVLATGAAATRHLRELERHVAALFGVELGPWPEGDAE